MFFCCQYVRDSVCLLVDFLVVNLLLCDYGSADFSNLYICCERTGNNKTLETVADGIDKSQACDMNVEANSTDTTDGRHDDKPRPYWCNVCHKRFARRRYLNIHERMHSGEKSFQCTQCEKRFSSPFTLDKHMIIHTGEYKCTDCGRCCLASSHLAGHRPSHSGEKPFECTVCGK